MTGMNVRYRNELPALVKSLGLPMVAAELGCAEGYFSADLLRGGLTLYMVDAWETLKVKGDGSMPQEWHDKNFNEAMKRVREFGNRAIVLRGMTKDMAELVPDNSLGLLYLDAGHTYEAVKEDLNTWYPKLVKGGVCAGHDFLSPQYGVQQAVMEFAKTEVFTIQENKPEDAGFLFFK